MKRFSPHRTAIAIAAFALLLVAALVALVRYDTRGPDLQPLPRSISVTGLSTHGVHTLTRLLGPPVRRHQASFGSLDPAAFGVDRPFIEKARAAIAPQTAVMVIAWHFKNGTSRPSTLTGVFDHATGQCLLLGSLTPVTAPINGPYIDW